MAVYRVGTVADTLSERSAHVPYTTQALVVLATVIIRWYMALVRSPIKMIATDADNTLWSGVIGEDGHVGIRVEPGHAALHKMLVGQKEAGCLLCLMSKNEEIGRTACRERMCQHV